MAASTSACTTSVIPFEGTGYPTLLRRAEAVKPARPSTLEIRHVNAEELCKQADRIQTLYPGPAMDASVFIGMLSQPGFHHFLAYAGDEAVAGSVLWVDGAFGYLGFGSTAEAYRNRGAQSEMICARISKAIVSGCQWVASETLYMLKTSLGNLERHDFSVVYDQEVFVWTNQAT